MTDTKNPQIPEASPLLSQDTAPFIYFDSAPTYGVIGGVVQVELTANLVHPTPDSQGTLTKVTWAAHLRCSPFAASALRDALNGALDMLTAAAPAPEKAGSKLN